jgi:hypothetical protein
MEEEEEALMPELRTHTETLPKMTNQPNADTLPAPKPKKMQDVYIKIHNASNMIHTNHTGCFPATSSSRNKYSMMLV